jgi:hypothetical protein
VEEEETKARIRLEEPKSTEAILADQFARGVVKYIDEHVLVRVTGEKAREDLYEVFLVFEISDSESLPDVKPMRPFRTIEPYPQSGSVGAHPVQPGAILPNFGLDFLEGKILREG